MTDLLHPTQPLLRRELAYNKVEAREYFYYLEFCEASASFYLTTEHCPAEGAVQTRRVPLAEAYGQHYYQDALLVIKEELFKRY